MFNDEQNDIQEWWYLATDVIYVNVTDVDWFHIIIVFLDMTEILPAKFLENFLRVKSHSGEEKNTGKQKCFGGKIWGAKNFESKFLPLIVCP